MVYGSDLTLNSNITYGISTDIRGMRNELGMNTIELNVGQDRQFVTVDKDGNQIGKAFTLADYLQDPSLAANKLFSNGIMNNLVESISNAQMQLKSTDDSGRVTILYDPSAKGEGDELTNWQKIKGLASDLGEVGVNYLGANVLGGLIQTKGQATDEKFITAVTNNAKSTGTHITLAGHSGGGLRNFLAIANSSQGQYLDANGNSVLSLQFSGTPVSYLDMMAVGNYAGVGELKMQNNPGDFVGNVLGANGNVLQAVWSVMNGVSLFEPKIPLTEIKLQSPHSNYECVLSNCYSGQLMNPIPKPNSP